MRFNNAVVLSATLAVSNLSFAQEHVTTPVVHQISKEDLSKFRVISSTINKLAPELPNEFKQKLITAKPILEKFDNKEGIILTHDEFQEIKSLYDEFNKLKKELTSFQQSQKHLIEFTEKTKHLPEWLKEHNKRLALLLNSSKTDWQNSKPWNNNYTEFKSDFVHLLRLSSAWLAITKTLDELKGVQTNLTLSNKTKNEISPLEERLQKSLSQLNTKPEKSLKEFSLNFQFPDKAESDLTQIIADLNSNLGEHREIGRVSGEDANRSLFGFTFTLSSSFLAAGGIFFYLRRKYW